MTGVRDRVVDRARGMRDLVRAEAAESERLRTLSPAIVDEIITMQWIDFGDRKPVRAFVCTNPNPWGYPAKDRSGRLEQLEPPNLGALIDKLTRPGQRKPFVTVSPEQPTQT